MSSFMPRSCRAPERQLPPAPASLRSLATAFTLDPAESRLLWLLAAPALDMDVLRIYRERWPGGPWPDVRIACRLACADRPFAGAALLDRLAASPLLRFGLVRIRTVGDRMTARIAPDILRALDGRAPRLPAALGQQARLLPIGQGWRATVQARLEASLAHLATGGAHWLCIDADPDDGTLDALAAAQPTLCVSAVDEHACAALDLRTTLRVARTRRLLPLVRVSATTWPTVCEWVASVPAGLIVERPRGLELPPPTALHLSAESLTVSERRAVWAAEVDPATARWLARRHPAGRALIQRSVDALRLRGATLSRRTLDAEVMRRRRSKSRSSNGEPVDFPTTFR